MPWSATVVKGGLHWNQNISRFLLPDSEQKQEPAQVCISMPWSATVVKGGLHWNQNISRFHLSDPEQKQEPAQVCISVPWSVTVVKGGLHWNQNITRFLLPDSEQKQEPAQVCISVPLVCHSGEGRTPLESKHLQVPRSRLGAETGTCSGTVCIKNAGSALKPMGSRNTDFNGVADKE